MVCLCVYSFFFFNFDDLPFSRLWCFALKFPSLQGGTSGCACPTDRLVSQSQKTPFQRYSYENIRLIIKTKVIFASLSFPIWKGNTCDFLWSECSSVGTQIGLWMTLNRNKIGRLSKRIHRSQFIDWPIKKRKKNYPIIPPLLSCPSSYLGILVVLINEHALIQHSLDTKSSFFFLQLLPFNLTKYIFNRLPCLHHHLTYLAAWHSHRGDPWWKRWKKIE